MVDSTLDDEAIECILKRQLANISELRRRMAEVAHEIQPQSMLAVGEGTEWLSTWIGHCIARDMIPGSLRLVVVLDMVFAEGSMRDDGFCSLCIGEGDLVPIVADATSIPLCSNLFDLTVAPLMIDDCSNHWALVCELYRCTRRAGIIMVSGHGIDLVGELTQVPELIGSQHANPCSPVEFDELVTRIGGRAVLRWSNEHTWVNVFQKT